MNINDVKEFVTLPNGLVTVIAKPCEVPPEGWTCSRERGHKGPCAATRVPTLCKSCGTDLDFNQCFCEQAESLSERIKGGVCECCSSNPCLCATLYSTEQYPIKANSVAIIERCELGEHCRCVMGDQADCWNWIGEVKL